MNLILTVSITLMLCVQEYTSLRVSVEAELFPGKNPVNFRTGAVGGKTVLLKKGDDIAINFCLARSTKLRVKGVVYSNDGASDYVRLQFQGNTLGIRTTVAGSAGGANWNVFRMTGGYGNVYSLQAGVYSLILSVVQSGDQYGVEVDTVVFDVNDHLINNLTFECKVICQPNVLPVIPSGDASVSSGHILQDSYPTQCAEEDNVNIPVFHPSVREYRLTASFPQYTSFKNLRAEDTSNCKFLDYIYWQFKHISLQSLISSEFTFNAAVLRLRYSPATYRNPDNLPFEIQVTFSLPGLSKGYIDANIGSTVFLTLDNTDKPTYVTIVYINRDGKIKKDGPVAFSGGSPNASWAIPDFTWTEGKNELSLQIVSKNHNIVINDFHIERRYIKPNVVTTILNRPDIVIKGVDVDFWWRAPETMEVSFQSGATFNNVDFLKISTPIPWNGGWGEIFVLYQDGNTRLLPRAPPGLNWIPYGTSVIIGKTEYPAFRPSAPISDVFISLDPLTLDLKYRDGGSARLRLNSLVSETQMTVSNLVFIKSTTSPFATFRSMYVSDGITDSDIVSSDQTPARGIMENWERLDGKSFRVARRCESTHLTQSPEIQLDITGT